MNTFIFALIAALFIVAVQCTSNSNNRENMMMDVSSPQKYKSPQLPLIEQQHDDVPTLLSHESPTRSQLLPYQYSILDEWKHEQWSNDDDGYALQLCLPLQF